MNFKEFKEGLEKIGYAISKDMGGYRIIEDDTGNELELTVWNDEKIEFRLGDYQKCYLHLKDCEIGISNRKTLSFGVKDFVYWQFRRFND